MFYLLFYELADDYLARRGEDAGRTPFSQSAGEVEREHDAQRGEQPKRVPVGDRVAQPLVGHVGRGVPNVGQHATDQARQAHRGGADRDVGSLAKDLTRYANPTLPEFVVKP